MKFGILALLVATVEGKAMACRKDEDCAINWVKKSCCGSFHCDSKCSLHACRVDTCGVTFCAPMAKEFKTRVIEGTPPIAAIPAQNAIPAVPELPPLLDINGDPIPGSGRPALPEIPARKGRMPIPASGKITCKFLDEAPYVN